MIRNSIGILRCFFLLLLFPVVASAQVASSGQPSASPVSYSSVTQLNQLLTQLDQVSQTTQVDLAGTRIDRWKTDSTTKRQTQANVESLQRNLKAALPEIVGQLRNSPESLAASFKLYRNLDALYDVLSSVVEAAGAFGSKDEFQSLDNDFNTIETARRSLAERMQSLAESKEVELTQLRTQVHNAQTTVSAPPKKVIVDDTEPPKKPAVKKKPVTKPAATVTAKPSSPAATPGTNSSPKSPSPPQ